MCKDVAHLVARLYQSADETSHNHDFIEEDGVEDGRPWHAGSQEQIHEQQRSCNRPVPVNSVRYHLQRKPYQST